MAALPCADDQPLAAALGVAPDSLLGRLARLRAPLMLPPALDCRDSTLEVAADGAADGGRPLPCADSSRAPPAVPEGAAAALAPCPSRGAAACGATAATLAAA